jgi:hypothetical protein
MRRKSEAVESRQENQKNQHAPKPIKLFVHSHYLLNAQEQHATPRRTSSLRELSSESCHQNYLFDLFRQQRPRSRSEPPSFVKTPIDRLKAS